MKNSNYTYDYFMTAFDQAKSMASSLMDSANQDILLRKPSEDKWSMAEILNHLVQAGNEYLSQIKKAIDKPNEDLTRGKEPFTPNFVFRWFIGQVSPENQRKLPTIPSFEPVKSSDLDPNKTLRDFLILQDEYIHILKRAKLEGWDLNRIKARNPVIKIIPMSLTACFGISEAHQRRHFEQMRALKEQFGNSSFHHRTSGTR